MALKRINHVLYLMTQQYLVSVVLATTLVEVVWQHFVSKSVSLTGTMCNMSTMCLSVIVKSGYNLGA